MDVEGYKRWYLERYGKKPSDKLIESFCKANGIQMESKEEYELPVLGSGVEMKFGGENDE